MKIGYLVNQYPKVSHSFVRREIAALEALGETVARYTVRRTQEKLADPADLAELDKTQVILDEGKLKVGLAILRVALTRPGRFRQALELALKVGRRSDRGPLLHLVYLAEACVLLGWLKREDVGHLHAHFGTNSATVAMLVHELGGPSFSFTAHGPEEFDKPEFIALGEKIRRAAFVAGVSSFGQSQLYRQVEAKDWDKINIVRCGVDASFLAKAPTPVPEVPQLVTVGRLSEQKGHLVLVEAARRLRDRGRKFKLVLVGDGELRAPIEATIQEHRLADTIVITGWASGAEVQKQVVASRALVLPSFAEGLPVVIMEAFALGRPVVSTYIAGIPELVEPMKSGWLVPAGAVDPLVDAMDEVLATPAERLTEMGLYGRKRVEEAHDIQRSAKALAELFAGTRA
ncbi:MAG: glycosyltransferase family 4 protein [Myxococcota bacterium]